MPTPTLSIDTLFAMLSDARRRYTLHHLLGSEDGVADIGTLAERIAAWERATDRRDASVADVVIDLHHAHLPLLADVGLVEYDERSGAVRYRDRKPVRDCFERTPMWDLPETT